MTRGFETVNVDTKAVRSVRLSLAAPWAPMVAEADVEIASSAQPLKKFTLKLLIHFSSSLVMVALLDMVGVDLV